MRRALVACLAAVLLSAVPVPFAATPASADPGGGITSFGYRLEGEGYSTTDSACDPDWDNEHTTGTGGNLYMPHSGCGVNFGTVTFQNSGSFGSFRADTWSGTGETVTSRVEIVVDGSIAASGSITRAPGAGFATVSFSSANAIAAGSHTLRIQYTVTTGPVWSNLRLDWADMATVVTQIGSKSSGTGCTQPPSSSNYDIRDASITHWINYHVPVSPVDVRRIWVEDATGTQWVDDVRTHNVGTGDWCAEMVQPIDGTFFQPRPGSWHVETYMKTVSGTWARVAPNLTFTVWPRLTTGGTYKNTPGDGVTSFTSADGYARVSTTWNTTSAINHSIRYKWYRPDGTLHASGGSQSLPSGYSSYQINDALDIVGTGANAYLGTWTVRTWIDDTNYMSSIYSFTLSAPPAAPGNDNFVNATTITAPYSASASNASATSESGEPQPCGSTGSTVWYRYTPSQPGTAVVDTLQAGTYDTVLAVYTGSSVNALTTVGCNDDYTGTLSRVSWSLTAGTTYWIQLGGYSGATGTATLRLTYTPPPPPANDNFANATTIGAPYNQSVTNAWSTLESGEPRPCGNIGTSVWYRYTPSQAGTATVDTLQAGTFDTILAAYTGSSLTALTNVACNDDYSGGLSQISFPVTAGTTYWIQLSGYAGATGTTTLRLAYTPPPPPANDNFAGAFTVTAPSSTGSTNVSATLQTGEPRPCGTTGATVWYRYTPSAGGYVTATTSASSFNTVLAAYTGSSVTALSTVGCNDDTSGTNSALTFQVTGGVTYYFQIGGNSSAVGTTTLNVTYTCCPSNDSFSGATPITATPYNTTQSTAYSTLESGEIAPCTGAGATVWFSYTHPSSAPLRRMFVDTFGSSYNTTMGVWTGSAIGSISLVACNDDARGLLQSQTSWTATPGVTYRIQVAGIGAATGTLKLRLVEGTLLALGDSVVAGHGIGPNPHGYPNNPTTAYPGLVGADLKLRVQNLARSGACASNNAVGDSRTPAACTGNTIVTHELNSVPDTPTHVVIGVGGNDVEFARCIKGFLSWDGTSADANKADMDACSGTSLTNRLAALQANLTTVVTQAKALSSPSPWITITGYYNPFSDAPTDYNQVCDMWMPAMMSRNQDMAVQPHNTAAFRAATIPVQRDAYAYAKAVVDGLNTTLTNVATATGATFVATAASFVNHDICRTLRGGTVADTWVYGPDWDDASNGFAPTVATTSYHSRPMPGLCTYPQSPGDDVVNTSKNNSPWWSYAMHFRPNCLAHPTPSGHQAIAGLVKPSLPIP